MTKPTAISRRSPPTGIIDTWKLWRHCLCRHGWYPIIVAPFVTVACLLDLYSSASCEFIRVNVGFDPLNVAWSEPIADIGFWNYQSGFNDNSRDGRNLMQGCKNYSENFYEGFIENDRAWTAARIMAFASGVSSLIALSAIWVLTICPLPSCFLWPGILLPAVLIGFLAGGAKFFILDADICQARIWIPSSSDASEDFYKAESCVLYKGAYFAIAAVATYFICLCFIFYRVPEKRPLDPNFGNRQYHNFGDEEKGQGGGNGGGTDDLRNEDASHPSHLEEEEEQREDVAQIDPTNSMVGEDDGVEAVMAKIGEFFKANDADFDCENDVLTKKELYQEKGSRESSSDNNSEIVSVDRVKSVEFDLEGSLQSFSSKKDPQNSKEREKYDAYLSHSGSDGMPGSSGSKSQRSRQHVVETIEVGERERESAVKLLSKPFAFVRKSSREREPKDNNTNTNAAEIPHFMKAMKLENEMKAAASIDHSEQTESVLTDVMSPIAVEPVKDVPNNSRYRAY